MKKKNYAQQREEDPFHNDYLSPTNQNSEDQPKYDKLYKMHKKQIDRQDKTKEDYEFERQQQECTFTPNIVTKKNYTNKESIIKNNRSQNNSVLGNSMNKDAAKERQKKMEEKQHERLKRAREEKERINGMLERGIPKAKPVTQAQMIEQEQKR